LEANESGLISVQPFLSASREKGVEGEKKKKIVGVENDDAAGGGMLQ
jgi:hypothetical protein